MRDPVLAYEGVNFYKLRELPLKERQYYVNVDTVFWLISPDQ